LLTQEAYLEEAMCSGPGTNIANVDGELVCEEVEVERGGDAEGSGSSEDGGGGGGGAGPTLISVSVDGERKTVEL
jgi:hypothetical protein